MKGIFKIARIVFFAAIALAFFSCSNGSDDNAALMALAAASGGGTSAPTTTTITTTPTTTTTTTTTETPGGQTTTPTSTTTYVITFNANDGSVNPATVTQNFTAGIAQALIPVEELGFSKAGFSFAGWGRAPKSKEASYADGASYTATANETLYALWSEIPVYSVNIPVNEHGTVTASPATGTAGTEITLSNKPNEGYQFTSYTVTDANGGTVTVTNGKFTMPAKNVTVTAVFTALTYTITFNANDGSLSPATATQTFTAGIPQNLKTVAELGFAKEGFNFAGWLSADDATEAAYADGASYTASANATLYALWSAIPVYSVNIPVNEHGTVAASPATATAGTEITLSNAPNAGYQFASYTVRGADGTAVTVTGGKFTMPEKNVTVTATFNAINYDISVGTIANGSVTTSPTTATVGTEITLSATPNAGYQLVSYSVRGLDGTVVAVADGKFRMPAKNVTVSATFSAIKYNINVGTFANGSVTATPATATVGTEITLSNTPNAGYQLVSYTVTDAGGTVVTVADGKFRMPAKNVTVSATFSAIKYNINVGTFANGSVTATPATATVGTEITLSATPNAGYKFVSYTVRGSDGTAVTVADGKFTMPTKNVTVTATFAALPPAASGAYKKTGTTTINSVEYDLVTFGLWPQTIKEESVAVNENETKFAGDFTYCRGSDGQWYAKIMEDAYKKNYKYSDGTTVTQRSDKSYKWFKVEPIKWRVLTTNYNGTGKKLLLAENILIGKRYDYESNNYQNSEIRKWLNSNANSAAASDHGGSRGFLKIAFTDAELAIIQDTSVVNNARSTLPDSYDSLSDAEQGRFYHGENKYASATPTTDKVFFLSEQEASKSEYGFDVYNAYKGDYDVYKGDGAHNESARIRQTTDYAKASGARQSITDGMGGWWWLRSPMYSYCNAVYYSGVDGYASHPVLVELLVNEGCGGVVPALCVKD